MHIQETKKRTNRQQQCRAIGTPDNFVHPLSHTTSRLQEESSSGCGPRSKTSASVIENARRARLVARSNPRPSGSAIIERATVPGDESERRPLGRVASIGTVGRRRRRLARRRASRATPSALAALGTAIVIAEQAGRTDKKIGRTRAIERADERASHRPPIRHAQGGTRRRRNAERTYITLGRALTPCRDRRCSTPLTA